VGGKADFVHRLIRGLAIVELSESRAAGQRVFP
jgi:hypothetical protein